MTLRNGPAYFGLILDTGTNISGANLQRLEPDSWRDHLIDVQRVTQSFDIEQA